MLPNQAQIAAKAVLQQNALAKVLAGGPPPKPEEQALGEPHGPTGGADDALWDQAEREEDQKEGGPPVKKAKNRKSTDDPTDKKDRYYMEPELVWWFTENLPNRWRACRTWKDLCEAASDGHSVECLAEGCERSWEVGKNWDLSACLMSMWSHMDSRAVAEKDWAEKWHANHNMMKQFLACYKREQLADLERERQGSSSSSSSSSSDTMGFSPPANIIQQRANLRGAWATQGGWGGKHDNRF